MPGPMPAHREGVVAQVVVADVDDPAGPLLDEGARHHLGRVLRLRPGESVCAADGAGGWRRCTFDGGERLVPGEEGGREPAPADPISVAFVPVKGDRPELVVQKLTELGVDRIVVTSSARSVVRWEGERADKHLQKLRRVALEATQQCRRLWLPAVEPASLAGLLSGGAALADTGGAEPGPDLRSVVVGPEGGWTDGERALAAAPPVSLGEHVLRAETAAITAGVVLAALRRPE
ncbi:RsmE family RNA methyltransferase [Dermatobacter hominis]|uniref:RsmE family RNA methyltransferase n=1 Tax=Dermatobacter hominis TaxID=2884263 RepID=UPI001D128C4D|nr:RsmE family RNA methyltransferase [Dermatobacter hominis]UDY35776.1 16S rRNA (uracil(1498)-N(3))-methyltransferase [Dermatobacter hominis]